MVRVSLRRFAVLTVAMWVLLAACGDSTAPGTLDTVAPTTTAPAASSTVPATPATTSVPMTAPEVSAVTMPVSTSPPASAAPHPRLIETRYGAAGPIATDASSPDGSGCSPGGDVLPDGLWFVAIEAIDEATLTLDLLCRFSGEAAFAHPEYGGGDHLYLNESSRLRTGLVAPDAVVWLLADPGLPGSQIARSPTEAAVAIADRGFAPFVWALVENSLVAELWEPWDS